MRKRIPAPWLAGDTEREGIFLLRARIFLQLGSETVSPDDDGGSTRSARATSVLHRRSASPGCCCCLPLPLPLLLLSEWRAEGDGCGGGGGDGRETVIRAHQRATAGQIGWIEMIWAGRDGVSVASPVEARPVVQRLCSPAL